MGIARIRRAVRQDRYGFTSHALEEMDEDDLSEADVRKVLQRGHVIARLARDSRGVRFVVRGAPGESERAIEIVCRFLPSGLLRIITVYQLES